MEYQDEHVHLMQCDCMDYMAPLPDKFYDLVIVDPPYGSENIERDGGTWSKKYNKKIKVWDIAPDENYFKELFRISKHAIIFGGNYFVLPPSNNFIIWRKLTISETFTMAMVEYAWTNIKGNAKIFDFIPQDSNRFHPTQKPVALYKWLIQNYAKTGWKLFDSHGGSMSSAIAAYDMGFHIDVCEKDADYFNDSVKRYKKHIQQGRLFEPEMIEPKQENFNFEV